MSTSSSGAGGEPASAVFDFVRSVPAGKVVTYGQVAECVTTVALTARQVGQIMSAPPPDVPWHRVVGAGGGLPISKRAPELGVLQRHLLQGEGVAFLSNEGGGVDMARHQWGRDEWAQPALFDDEPDATPGRDSRD